MGGGASRGINNYNFVQENDTKDALRSSNAKVGHGDEDTLKVAWITSETAWVLGEQFISSVNLSLVKESLKGVASLGKTVPLVGPVVGAVLQFWQCYETMGRAAANFQQLQKQVDLASDWLVLAAPLLTSRGMSAVLLKEMQGLCSAVQHATQLVEAMSRRIGHKGNITSGVYNFVLSSEDKGAIEECRDELYKAVESFKSSFPAEERLRSMADTCSKLYKLLGEPILFDATIQLKLRECMAGSREWLHEEVERWLAQDEGSSAGKKESTKSKIFWFQASAGMGKTVFAASLVDRLKRYRSHAKISAIDNQGDNRLLGAVFFNFTDARASQPITVVKSLVYQVARALPEVQASMLAAAEQVMASAEKDNVSSLFSLLLCTPLQEYANNHKGSTTMEPMVLVLDALDEAGVVHSQERQQLLSFLSRKAVRELPSWIRIFITGRPEPDILQALGPFAHSIEEEDRMKQHQLDLFHYISYRVEPFMVSEQECQKVSQALVEKSESKFVYVSMVAEEVENFFLDKDMHSLTAREVIQEVESLPQGLDECYSRYMKKIMLARKNVVKETVSSDSVYDNILLAFLCVEVSIYEVISVVDMQWLLDISEHDMKLLIQSVQAVFPVQDGKFVPFHKSIIDWLTNADRSHNYFVSIHSGHAVVAERCLESKLGLNVSRIRSHCAGNSEDGWTNLDHGVAQQLLASSLSPATSQFSSYTARFLLDHLDSCDKRLGYPFTSYLLLTDLWWMLFVLRYANLTTLIESYRIRHMDGDWCIGRDVSRKDVKLLLRCLKLMDGSLSVNYPAGPMCELCTQLEGRLRRIMGKSARIDRLIADALLYLKEQRGWRVMTDSLNVPAGKLEFAVEIQEAKSVCLLARNRVAIGFEGSIEIRNYATAQVEYTLPVSTIPIQLCFLPPNYVAYLFDGSPEIAVMNCMTGEIEFTLAGLDRYTRFLASFKNSILVSASTDGTIGVWDLSKDGALEISFSFPGYKICGLTVSDYHETVLTAYSYNGLYSWDLAGNCQKVISEICDKVFCNLNYVATINCVSMNSYAVAAFQQSTWEKVFSLSHVASNDSKASTACITSSDLLAFSSVYGICVYNLLNGDIIAELSGHQDYVTHLQPLDDSRLASAAYDFTFRVWNVKEDDSAITIERGKNIWAAAMLTSTLFALVFNNHKVELWCPQEGRLVDVLLVDGHAHNVFALSEDLLLVHFSDSYFQIWNHRSKTSYDKQSIVLTESSGEIRIRTLVCAVDTDLIVVVPESLFDIFLFNFRTMLWEQALIGHQDVVRYVALINGSSLASCGDDLNIIIWDMLAKAALRRIVLDSSPTQLNFFLQRNWLCVVLLGSDIVLYECDTFAEVLRSKPRDPARSISSVFIRDGCLHCVNKDSEECLSITLDQLEVVEPAEYTYKPYGVGELIIFNGNGVTYLDNALVRAIRCDEENRVYIFETYNFVLHCVIRECI